MKNPGPFSTFLKSKIRERTDGVSRCRTVKSNDTSINEEQTDFAKQNKNQRLRYTGMCRFLAITKKDLSEKAEAASFFVVKKIVGVTFCTLRFAEL